MRVNGMITTLNRPVADDVQERSAPDANEGIGQQAIADLYGINPSLLRDRDAIMATFWKALKQANFSIIRRVSHKFTGGGEGVTGIFLLAESHAAFHTYPELGYIAVDVFSCGRSEPARVLAAVVETLRPLSIDRMTVRRGKAANPPPGFES
jgi:S-adenosylmethionine decarboxylase